MAVFKVEGGTRLHGELRPQGAKNEALEILCATLLTPERVVVHNVPQIIDVMQLIELLAAMGVEVEHLGGDSYSFRAADINLDYLRSEDYHRRCRRLRGSVMMRETIRSVTDLPIAIDANQGWKDKHHALDMIHWLHEKGIVMIEQPMPKEQLDDIAWVTQQSPLPIFADESIQRLKDVAGLKGAFTGINIKLMKCTGMREAWKMVTLARALDMKVMVGCMTETSCAITAASQFSPAVDFADLDGSLLIANDRFKGMEVVKGKITLPDLPGIGVVKL